MSGEKQNPTEKAFEEMKKSVDQAMSQTEDAMARMGYDISAASKIAEDYRTKAFEYMRFNMNAAIDYADNFTGMKWPTGLVGLATGGGRDHELTPPALRDMSSAAMAAETYRSRMFQFMKANLNMMLEYAEQLAAVKTPTEFVELSTSHARKQFDSIAAQTDELHALAQTLASWDKGTSSS